MKKKLISPLELSNIVQDQQEEVDLIKRELSFNNKILKWVQGFMIAIVIVCFITFIGIITDTWRFHGEKTKEYQQTIDKLQNENLELRINKIINSKLDSITASANDSLKN